MLFDLRKLNAILFILLIGAMFSTSVRETEGASDVAAHEEVDVKQLIQKTLEDKMDRNHSSFSDAIKILRGLGSKAIPHLREYLKSKQLENFESKTAYGFFYILIAETRCNEAIPFLLEITEAKNLPHREISVGLLGNLSHILDVHSAEEFLAKLIESQDKWIVRMMALDALTRIAPKKGIPTLFEHLQSSHPDRRRHSNGILKRLTKKDFGFDPKASEADRQAAIERWNEWWASANETFSIPKSESEEF